METVMCLAVLGVVAFSLQGCGSEAMDKAKEDYKQAVKDHIKSKASAAVTAVLVKSGACPPLHASIQVKKEALVTGINEKIVVQETCQKSLVGDGCQKSIAFEIADMVMYIIERDPTFMEWQKEYHEAWNNVKETINSVIEEELMAPVRAMQDAILANELVIGTKAFIDFVKELTDAIIDTVIMVVCPATQDEIDAVKAKDAPLVKEVDKAEMEKLEETEKELKEEAGRRLVDDIVV